jgi:Na+-transporting methylmalonyl-CoA/oxaloacetate decarboxylase gamma subunit
MISPLTATLWITLIGMGLVFIAILLLWGLMEAMMRLSARFAGVEKSEFDVEPGEEGAIEELPVPGPAGDQKKRAAAAAVATALALQPKARRAAAPQTAGSAWQAVNRASQLNQSTHIVRKS